MKNGKLRIKSAKFLAANRLIREKQEAEKGRKNLEIED
jgi:hypothetical protein